MKRLKSPYILLLICLVIPAYTAGPLGRPAMISVRGGTFFMGSSEYRVHETTVHPFLISQNLVTQELYTSVMNENPSFFKGDNLPVDSVSWFDAVQFCNALSARFGLAPAYIIEGENVRWNRESKGYRLPTETEWEFAARGGRLGGPGPLEKVSFAGGNEEANPQDYCWFSLNSRATTRPVGEKLPNQLGIFDMSGNVWEWCWDWYSDYPAGPVNDYIGPAEGKQRIYRGGSYMNNLNQLRTTFRIWDAPFLKVRSLGFRIAQNG
ncbi:MAG: formylglycine-generating enzyme family protein [Treponema sp.]|nr:formylglycine-generating enzyme family protein [Treponema sp.]